ncbi:MAG: universal stress protein [Solirubrobacteraceae bacterium]
MKVLLAYDGSTSAQAAVRAAAELLPGADAVVLTVYEAPTRLEHLLATHATAASATDRGVADLRRMMQDDAMAVAREGAELATEGGLAAEAQTAATSGSAWPVIREEATRQECAALVCGSRGRGGLSRAWLGSISSALLHHATLPTLVVPERSPEPRGPLLLAYDGSEPARAVIATAAALFGGRPTVVVHVWESPLTHWRSGHALMAAPVTEIRELTADLDELLANSAQQEAEKGADLARQRGLGARAKSVESATGVWRALIETAQSTDAGVVAVGSRGRGALASTFLGSVSSGLVHNAELPVLVVPS